MTGIWPGLTQCTVNLGFDIDAQSNWIGRDPAFRNRPVMMTAADYGPKVGVPRILNLMDEYGLKASFFIPGFTAEQYPDLVKEILARGPRGCRPRLHAPAARGTHPGKRR